jgi:hypothetical protein
MSDIPDILTLYPVSKIETLERAARIDGLIAKQLSQSMSINAKLQARIEVLEAALLHVQDCLGYDKNEGKSMAVREANSHSAWKIARAALDKDAGK